MLGYNPCDDLDGVSHPQPKQPPFRTAREPSSCLSAGELCHRNLIRIWELAQLSDGGIEIMRRRLVILGVVLVIVIGIVVVVSMRNSQTASALSEIQTVAISTGPLTASVGATGTVRANQSTSLSFETTGLVEVVHVGIGDPVSAGEVLASLTETSLPATVILAKSDLVAAERALDDLLHSEQARTAAQKALAQAQDALDDAQYIQRVRQEGNRASKQTLDAAKANLVLSENRVDNAKAAYDKVSGHSSDDPVKALALSKLAAARQSRDSDLRNLNWYLGRPSELEQALLDADVAAAEANLADAEREWLRLKDGPDPVDVTAAEARIAAAEATLKLGWIEAPFEGTITSVEINPGDRVSPGGVGFGLADLSRLLVEVEISEVDINRIQVGQPVSLAFDAILERSYQGEVVEIGLIGNSVQGVVNFEVTVELMDPDELVRPGMTAAVSIVVEQIEDALLVPNRAVRLRNTQRVVYVMKDGVPEPVEIQLGASSETHSEVLDGDLRVGDQIALNPPIEFEQFGPMGFGGRFE